MLLGHGDLKIASKIISDHVDYVTCLQCCKYFVAPETAACSHTLCHLCWGAWQSCPSCNKKINKKALVLNMQMKITTDHVKDLVKSFEKIFGIKMEEYGTDLLENYQNKNVKEWLSSSQNHFSAPPYSVTPSSTQDVPVVQVPSNEIQVHVETNKNEGPPKIVHVPPPQDDWDMIETVPNTEDILEKHKENVVGPMDLEPFYIDDNEYSAGNPRRSSRKRDIKDTLKKSKSPQKGDDLFDKHGSNNSSLDTTEKRLEKVKQNWTNVKKMRKEFSKLNKENKNKLNVSIEMCKKSKSVVSKQASSTTPQHTPVVYNIEENSPCINNDKDAQENRNIVPKVKEIKKSDAKDVEAIDEDELPDVKMNSHKNKTNKSSANQTNKKPVSIKKASQVTTNQVTNDNQTKESPEPQENGSNYKKIPFIKNPTFQNKSNNENHTVTIDHNNLPDTTNTNDDDIHITIRIGSVVTNITINKKQNDVHLKVNADREVQASLGPNGISHKTITEPAEKKVVEVKEAYTETDNKTSATYTHNERNVGVTLPKSSSTKKNTASAETATVQYEITESVEKELSHIMECEETDEAELNIVPTQIKSVKPLSTQRSNKSGAKSNKVRSESKISKNQEEIIDDLDIFNSGSVKEVTVEPLKSGHSASSEILVSTYKTNGRTRKLPDKRNRDVDGEEQIAKRQKFESQVSNKNKDEDTNKLMEVSSENTNYDAIMSQVFANIDADMKVNSKTRTVTKNPAQTQDLGPPPSQVILSSRKQTQKPDSENTDVPKNFEQKHSENMFSTIGNIDAHVAGPETQKHIDNLLTPGMCRDLGETRDQSAALIEATPDDVEKIADDVEETVAEDVIENVADDVIHNNFCTPAIDDDSDKSVVEDTPQKNLSNLATKTNSANRTVVSNKKLNLQPPQKPIDEDVISIHDTMRDSVKDNDVTILDPKKRNVSETPLTINRFVGQIKHNSTPVARKSLTFSNEMENEDDDVTLCASAHEVARTTQEKELMSEAFATTPIRKPLQTKNIVQADKIFVVAGSCLSSTESTNLKILCFKRKWLFVDKYSPDLTHLVVGVDEENRSQRSVKYMCALAAGKWIVSYKWVEKCLESNAVANEEPYEALDSTGEAGPRRSRAAPRSLFQGVTFHCMPPFTLLDVDTLKAMLEAAGARVVAQPSGVRVRERAPALLLAEPAHTQEDKYIYLAMKLNIVPVNYEWALNCLGSYSLCSLLDLLLCPATLLPEQTKTWPAELLAVEE